MPNFSRRSFLATSLALAGCAQRNDPQSLPSGRKTNVLFLAVDDLNTGLGCYGHPLVKSPNIDRLSARGVRFDRAYCQFPLCGPSRASVLTGLRPDTTNVLGNNIDFRDALPNAVTLPQLFKNNGWVAAREGKMFHMNVPKETKTNRFQDDPSWHHSVSPGGPEEQSEPEGGDAGKGVNSRMHWVRTTDGKGQSDSNAAERALALLEKHRKEPFFLGVGFLRPHLPFVAPGRFYDMYPLDSVSLAQNPPNDLDDIPEAHKAVRPHIWNNGELDEKGMRETRRGYYASTSFMDEQVGRVVDGLDAMGLADNTVIVLWGDHGWSLGEHTHWQKMSLMEEVARVPLIIAAPGRAGNGRPSRSLVEFVDIYPTLADLCGLTPPTSLEGQSLVPLLDNPTASAKQAAFTQIAFEEIRGLSVRTDRFRYNVWKGKGGGEELYDHDNDPGEFTNLVGNAAMTYELERHRKLAQEYGLDRAFDVEIATAG